MNGPSGPHFWGDDDAPDGVPGVDGEHRVLIHLQGLDGVPGIVFKLNQEFLCRRRQPDFRGFQVSLKLEYIFRIVW